jgi:hypothetical protein
MPAAQPASSQESMAAPAEQAQGRHPLLLPVGLSAGALLLGVLAAIVLTAGDDDDTEDDDEIAQVDQEKASAKGSAEAKTDSDALRETPNAEADDGTAAVGVPRTKVGEALRAREVQALDVLLVTTEAEGPLPYVAAHAHCDGLEVAGLSDWRLPDIGELMSLTGAGMTGRGFYWSTTPADTFGDGHLVWYARRERIVTRDKPNLAVCVRGDVGAG